MMRRDMNSPRCGGRRSRARCARAFTVGTVMSKHSATSAIGKPSTSCRMIMCSMIAGGARGVAADLDFALFGPGAGSLEVLAYESDQRDREVHIAASGA